MTGGEKIDFSLEERIELLSQTMGLEGIDRCDLEFLADRAVGITYPKNGTIFDEGEAATTFYMVSRGRVKLIKRSHSGRSITAVLAGRGSTLNAVVLFDGRAHFLSAQAMDQVDLFSIPGEVFVQFTRDHPRVAINIIKTLGRIVESSYERLMDLVSEKVEQRILNLLLMLSVKFGPNLAFTAAELAELAGTTTETTLRVMSRLRELDIIDSSRGRIEVIDPERLKSLGRGPFLI